MLLSNDKIPPFLIATLFFLWPACLFAHNGKVAVVVPVESMVVDGDFSDWPEDMRRYPIAHPESGQQPENEDDYRGEFRVGYNRAEAALYVAVEVRDDEAIHEMVQRDLIQSRDGCEVYLDTLHHSTNKTRLPQAIWSDYVYGLKPREAGVGTWDGETWRYEWRLQLPPHRAVSGARLAFDIVITDWDDGALSSTASWGPGWPMLTTHSGMGDLILVDESAGRLEGSVTWEDGTRARRIKVKIQSLDKADLLIHAVTDDQGYFHVELPAGAYRVETLRQQREILLAAGETETLDIVAPFATGQRTIAGTGRAVPAGQGHRRGAWQTFGASDGLPSDSYRTFMQDQEGALWMGTGVFYGSGSGVVRYDGAEFTRFDEADGLVHRKVTAIVQEKSGAIWFATFGGLSRYDGKYFVNYTVEDGLPIDEIECLIPMEDGKLWYGTWGGGIGYYDGEHFVNFSTEDGLPGSTVRAMLADEKDQLWIATSGGLARYTTAANGRIFPVQNGSSETVGNSIYEDSKGHIWVGTVDKGISRYGGKAWTHYTTKDGLSNDHVTGIVEDQDGIFWCSTWGGVNRFDGETWQAFRVQDGLPNDQLTSIFTDRDGTIWVGGLVGGIARYTARYLRNFGSVDGLASNLVMDIAENKKGHIWAAGGNKGISRYDGKFWQVFTTEDGLAENQVNNIVEDAEGTMWIGTRSGLSRYNGKTWTRFNDGGWDEHEIWDIIEDKRGRIWVASWRGDLGYYDGGHWVRFTHQDQLIDDKISDLYEDHRGYLWISTWGGGLHVFDGTTLQNISAEDGLAHDAVQKIIQSRDGAFWIATEGGITRYVPSSTPPSIRLVNVIGDQIYGPVGKIDIDQTQDYLRFEFRGASLLTSPESMVYLYRLVGHDDQWRQTQQTQVEYADLPRGSYTFEVKAVDRDLNYSEPLSIGVQVHWPYERLTWGGLLGFALLAIALLGTKVTRQTLRLRRSHTTLTESNQTLKEQAHDLASARDEAETARSAADVANRAKSTFLANMSHEIRTPLNAILGYAQILQRDPEIAVAHGHAIQTIRHSGDHLLALINEVLDLSKIESGRMELNEADFDLGQLLHSLSVMFELRCQQDRLQWRMSSPQGALPVRGDEAKLSQALINLLGNAVKFTTEGEIALKVEVREEQHYYFEIADTGQGIDSEERDAIFKPFQQGRQGELKGGTGLGLSITQSLLRLMGAELELISTSGQGSSFSFQVRLPPALGELYESTDTTIGQIKRLKEGYTVSALVVDDVRENREILGQLLQAIGVEVSTANSGEEAIEQAEQIRPDIIFMDIRMPGIDGLEAARAIWAKHGKKAFRVVAVSASTLKHERQHYLAAGFEDFIDKPLRAETVYACMGELLGVEYEYAEDDSSEAKESINLSSISLPPQLCSELQQALATNNLTQIRGHLDEVEKLGETQLAARWRQRMQAYDTESILSDIGALHRE